VLRAAAASSSVVEEMTAADIPHSFPAVAVAVLLRYHGTGLGQIDLISFAVKSLRRGDQPCLEAWLLARCPWFGDRQAW